MTKPNESLTIAEMFKKWAKGENVNSRQYDPVWDPNPKLDGTDLEELSRADLYEKEEFSKKLGEEMKEMDKTIKKNAAEAAKAKEEEEDKKFIEKMKKHVPPPKKQDE